MPVDPTITVRDATEADLQAILDIYNEAVLNSTATADYEPQSMVDRVEWFELRKAQNLPIYVAVDNADRVLGWASLSRFHARIGYRFTVENSIYIGPDHRGKGTGGILLKRLIEAARAGGFHSIVADIDSKNDASIRLHRSHGFEDRGTIFHAVYKFDQWLDVFHMQLMLE
ncbi:MAG: N-acetyltransferase family protein [Chthonomonadales bacterium]